MDEIAKLKNPKSSIQVALTHGCHNLMSLPNLLARGTNGKEPLVDYFQNHVVTSKEYLRIMRQKTMDREKTKQIKEIKKERKIKKTNKENTYNVDYS